MPLLSDLDHLTGPAFRIAIESPRMASKRAILEKLTRDELLEVAMLGSVEVSSTSEVVTTGGTPRKTVLGELLRRYSVDRLREICWGLGLDETGDDRRVLAGRVLWTGEGYSIDGVTSATSRGRDGDRSDDTSEFLDGGPSVIEGLPRRQQLAITFPNVVGFKTVKEGLRCNVDAVEIMRLEPKIGPRSKVIQAVDGWSVIGKDAPAARPSRTSVLTRERFLREQPLYQTVSDISRDIVELLSGGNAPSIRKGGASVRVESARLLAKEVRDIVKEYVLRRVELPRGTRIEELALASNRRLVVERILERVEIDPGVHEPALLPRIDTRRPIISTTGLRFHVSSPTMKTNKSHLSRVVVASPSRKAVVRCLEKSPSVQAYASNDRPHVGIAYEWQGEKREYHPHYLVRMADGATWMIELAGTPSADDDAKWLATAKWITAVNNHGGFGPWKHVVCRDDPEVVRKLLATPAPPTNDGSAHASEKPWVPLNQREWWDRPRMPTGQRHRSKRRGPRWPVDEPRRSWRRFWTIACRCGKPWCDGVRGVSETRDNDMTVCRTGSHPDDPAAKEATRALVDVLVDWMVERELAKARARGQQARGSQPPSPGAK
jgi:hypothetical protein